ncbi:glucose-6-phosphate exchanger SLC37A1 [Sinocyclocheilus rhinocerous]|uniref:glucose-6-phosphate exchanger SLC37A1 n=1 Tax=Sinocyclocheilus rhinocerous TaxID=307959 RepID=UPI0007B8BE56|nr:PREDICTED: glycerol-3-phosphate transporter-like [Sinocyclocheilus rhinocerous]
MAPVPPGIRFLTSFNRDQWYRAFTFGLTFLLYTSFHLSRKPISIVKSELHKNCSHVMEASTESSSSQQPVLHPELDCSWKPFDRNNYKQLLGAMDYSFLCAYAIGMYLSGIIGERLPIRLYLTVGMLTSGLFTCLFGLGYVYDIHKLHKNWNGVNGHKDLYLQYKPGAKAQSWDTELLLGQESIGVCVPVQQVVVVKSEAEPSAISFMGALRIPGVVEFSLCLLFAKLVSYTFLFWLPLYITKAAHLDAKKAGDLSTLFDVGGIVGGILAGVLSDKLGKRATTCAVMLLLAAPTLYGFSMMSQFGFGPTIGMLLVCGGLVNGPYSLITTAVSADLGTHKSLKGNARALSTVTAIIDGTGSVGAAVGPLLAGLLSARGWDQVFYMLMTADFLALLLLLRLVMKEHRSHRNRPGVAVELKEH